MQQVVMSSLQHRCRGRWVMSLASVALSMLMSGMHNMVQAQAFPQRSVRMTYLVRQTGTAVGAAGGGGQQARCRWQSGL